MLAFSEMRIANGKVVDGKVVIEGEPLAEGTSVTVLLVDEEGFELDAEQTRELSIAIAEAQRGQGIDGDAFLRQLDAD